MGALEAKKWQCWHCGSQTGNDRGYAATEHSGGGSQGHLDYIYVCPVCSYPTFFDQSGDQFPGAQFGEPLTDLPPLVDRIYDEARRAMSVAGYHAAAMLCRKLLMHIAVEKGAKENKSFASYVDHLVNSKVIADSLLEYATHVKDLGNEANHEIREIGREEAEEMISFLEMVCRTVYVYPAQLRKRKGEPELPRAEDV